MQQRKYKTLLVLKGSAVEVRLDRLDLINADNADINIKNIGIDYIDSINGNVLDPWSIAAMDGRFYIEAYDESDGEIDVEFSEPFDKFDSAEIFTLASTDDFDLKTPRYGFCIESRGVIGHISIVSDSPFNLKKLRAIKTRYENSASLVDRFSYEGFTEEFIGVPMIDNEDNNLIAVDNAEFMDLTTVSEEIIFEPITKISKGSIQKATNQFTSQFKNDEYDFCAGLQDPSDDVKLRTMQLAFAKFKIARCFKLQFDKGLGLRRYEPLLSIIKDLDLTNVDSTSLVLNLEEKIRKVYGGHGKFLSAASKIAWLLTTNISHDPYKLSTTIIYDSYAAAALKSLDLLISNHTYQDYLEAWFVAFHQSEKMIDDVIKSQILINPNDVILLKSQNLNLRIHDLHLYSIGARANGARYAK